MNFTEAQSVILSQISELLQQVTDAGLTVKVNNEANLAIMQKDIVDKILAGEEIPEEYKPTENEENIAKELNKLVNSCQEEDILFNCGEDGMYAIDKNFYDSFLARFVGEAIPGDEDVSEFQSHMLKIDDHGAYYRMPEHCTCCDTECDICDCKS